MLPINVKALLDTREIESSRIEYKRKWNIYMMSIPKYDG